MSAAAHRATQVAIRLDHLEHNVRLLEALVGGRPLWPCVKSNAYGHGAEIVARHLTRLGCSTLGVADVVEGIELVQAGVDATVIIFPESLPEQSEAIVEHGFEPSVATLDVVEALSRHATAAKRQVSLHVKVDTGMGRVGLKPADVPEFLTRCAELPGVRVRGLMSHCPRADEGDRQYSVDQVDRFRRVIDAAASSGIEVRHMANSAAIFDLPEAHFDAARPGIAIYGLRPSRDILNPRVNDLRPVLEWRTRITFLKDVPTGTGLSYGHTVETQRPSLIATIPDGYADGLQRNLSNRVEFIIGGRRCPQVGRITMNLSLVDVTELRDRVQLGDEVVLIGGQGDAEVTADELAETLGTINYEVVTAISQRVPRVIAQDSGEKESNDERD